MRGPLLLLCCLISFPLWADITYSTRIHDIDRGEKMDDEVLILFTNGRVARMARNKSALLDELEEAKVQGTYLTITLNENKNIIAFEEAPAPKLGDASIPSPEEKGPMSYTPSVVGTTEAAQRFFNEVRYNSKDSQCFNRAHVWSYEWRKNHNLYSSKIWIFFTRKFLRQYATFDWWFHVAPMIYVNEGGAVKERAMDVKYSKGPLPLQKWAAIFMKGKGPCTTVDKFSEHANYPYEGYCYFQKTSMYYYQPVDLEFLEKYGTQRKAWVEAEVREAFREAFDIYL